MKKDKFPFSVVFLLIAGIFLVGTDELIVSPLLNEMAEEFGSSLKSASLTVAFYGLAIGVAAPLIAPVIDKLPRQKLIVWALLGFSAACFLCAAANGMAVLLSGRFLSGLFAGMFIPSAYAYAGDAVAKAYRAKVMGLVLSGWSISLLIGIPAGSYLGEALGWRLVFAVVGVSAAVLAAASFFFLQNSSSAAPQSLAGRHGLFQMLKVKQVSVLILATFCNMFGFYGMYTFVAAHLQSHYSTGLGGSGEAIFFYGLGIAISPLTGPVVDKLGKREAMLGSLVGLAGLLLAISALPLPLYAFYVLMALWGGLQSLFLTSISSLLADQSEEHRGKIMSLYSLAVNIGVALGSWGMGHVFESFGFAAVGMACALVTGMGAAVYGFTVLAKKGLASSKSY